MPPKKTPTPFEIKQTNLATVNTRLHIWKQYYVFNYTNASHLLLKIQHFVFSSIAPEHLDFGTKP